MPATSEWDEDEIVAAVVQQLRLSEADADLERIQRSVSAACIHVDHEVDRAEPGPVTATMFAAAVMFAVQDYTWPANAFDSYALGMQVGGDPRANIRSMLAADKEQWPVA